MGNLQGGETTDVAKFEVVALGDVLPNCFVKVDDAAVAARVECREEGLNIITVDPEFESPVWERVDNGFGGEVEHVIPFETRRNDLGGLGDAPGGDADLAELVNNLVIKLGREGTSVDCVEINGAVGEDARPLRLGQRWGVTGSLVLEGPQSPFWVEGIFPGELSSPSAIVAESDGIEELRGG